MDERESFAVPFPSAKPSPGVARFDPCSQLRHRHHVYGYRAWSIRCANLLVVRSQAARNVAALLDFDPGVASFACRASTTSDGANRYDVSGTDGSRWMMGDEDDCFLDLWGSVRAANCRWLLSVRPRPVGRQMLVDAAGALGREEACTVGGVLRGLSSAGGLGAFAFLVASGVAVLDMDEEPITFRTAVRAGRPPFNIPAERGER